MYIILYLIIYKHLSQWQYIPDYNLIKKNKIQANLNYNSICNSITSQTDLDFSQNKLIKLG